MLPAIAWRPLVAAFTIACVVMYSWFGNLMPNLDDRANFDALKGPDHKFGLSQKTLLPIPKKIWQINFNHPKYTALRRSIATWRGMNPEYDHTLLTDDIGKEIIQKHYGRQPEERNTYLDLNSLILRSDYIRYLVLAAEGGVYSDLDTDAIKPIDEWLSNSEKGRVRAMIGIEYDRLNESSDPKGFYMPMQFCQWTLAFSAHHPLMIAMLDSVTKSLHQLAHSKGVPVSEVQPSDDNDVLFTTGPVKWSQEVFSYLSLTSGTKVTDRNLTGLKEPRLFGDVMIMPINAFAAGLGFAGSRRSISNETLLWHRFLGTWKAEGGRKLDDQIVDGK